jgi:peptidoglycan/xylan/chitin deacetylase (PgdA/CDA1 family)
MRGRSGTKPIAGGDGWKIGGQADVRPPPVLVYHRVSRHPLLAGTWVTPAGLGRQLDILAREGLRALDADAWLALAGGGPGAATVDAVPGYLVTFDDGTDDLWHHREVLDARGVRPVVFVPAGLLGRRNAWEWRLPGRGAAHLSAARLRTLADAGWEIGLHGTTHRDLTRLADRALAEELAGGIARLADATGRPVRLLSYPFGQVDARVAARAEAAGIVRAFVVARAPREVPGHLAHRRRPVYCIDTPASVLVKLRDPDGRTLPGRWERWKEAGAHGVGRWTAGRRPQGDEGP